MMSTGSELARIGSCCAPRMSQLIAQLKYACDRSGRRRPKTCARSIPIAFGLEKTLLIQLEREGTTLLSRFECVRESSAAPRVRFFVRALL
jgi:hypothetical protein